MLDILLIGGLDSSGFSGLAADERVLKAFQLSNIAVSSLQSIKTADAFSSSQGTEPQVFRQQLEAALQLEPKAIKIGALANEEIVAIVDELLSTFSGHVVLDPILSSSSGGELLSKAGFNLLKQRLVKRATILTPNLLELESLLELDCQQKEGAIRSAIEELSEYCDALVLLKGGHRTQFQSRDILCYKEFCLDLIFPKLEIGAGFRGTGCHLATAISAYLVLGHTPADAVYKAREWFQTLLNTNIAKGNSQLIVN